MATRCCWLFAAAGILTVGLESTSSGSVAPARTPRRVFAIVPMGPTDKPLSETWRVDRYGYIRNALGNEIGIWGVEQSRATAVPRTFRSSELDDQQVNPSSLLDAVQP
jgi:hypothetical protein